MPTVVRHTRDHRGLLNSEGPRCYTLHAYWDVEGLDANGDLLFCCDPDEDEDEHQPAMTPKRVSSLIPRDLVDAETLGDCLGDDDADSAQFEYFVVAGTEVETPDCTRVDFDN